jgi:N-methylhydantoinase A
VGLRVGIDIGGTFTDVVAFDASARRFETAKAPSTPDHLVSGVMTGLAAVSKSGASVEGLIHGTTVGVNALLERDGESVLLLATAGIGDTYTIARGDRTEIYNLKFRKPIPLVPRRDVVEIGGRLDRKGTEIEPLNEDDLLEALAKIQQGGHTAVAICFLFSYLNPDHELHAKRFLESRLDGGVAFSLSHHVAREWREYERASSTVMDAYIGRRVAAYLQDLEGELRDAEVQAPLMIMQSNGGVISASAARSRPLNTLLSGPVGGTAAGVALAQQLGRKNLICIDMGGTSFDVSLVISGKPDVSPEAEIEGFPILMSVVNIHTIGAGGGSIAFSEAGGLRVGPRSAGAVPGPASYGRGGTLPTVTDANLLLGRMDPGAFLEGQMPLDVPAARKAVGELARDLGMDPMRLAEGIVDVINAKMSQAIRRITVERGIEPRDFSIMAFGGAGPMHAAALAAELECREVIVPPYAGALSAWGMLHSPLRQDFSRTFYRAMGEILAEEIMQAFGDLEREARVTFDAEGIQLSPNVIQRFADVRYRGQEHSLTMPLTSQDWTEKTVDEFAQRFHEAYESRYGHHSETASLEIVNLRLAVVIEVEKPLAAPTDARRPSSKGAKATSVFGGTEYETRLLSRNEIRAGDSVPGPAVITEPTATTVVPPGWVAAIEGSDTLILTPR